MKSFVKRIDRAKFHIIFATVVKAEKHSFLRPFVISYICLYQRRYLYQKHFEIFFRHFHYFSTICSVFVCCQLLLRYYQRFPQTLHFHIFSFVRHHVLKTVHSMQSIYYIFLKTDISGLCQRKAFFNFQINVLILSTRMFKNSETLPNTKILMEQWLQ